MATSISRVHGDISELPMKLYLMVCGVDAFFRGSRGKQTTYLSGRPVVNYL